MNAITIRSFERGPRVLALRDVLYGLRYDVAIERPEAETTAEHRIAYLGAQPWPEVALESALSADLLAIEEASGEWLDGAAAARAGDLLIWPCTTRELILRLRRGGFGTGDGRRDEQRSEVQRQAAALGMIGRSPAFVDALVTLRQFGRSDAAILIQGETGTGKERAARAIHAFSARAEGPFVAVNCGALIDTLIESEFFGHASGAFTDAKRERAGLVEEACGGTLFLDELEALCPKGQVALLRFLESFEYTRVGSPRTRRADLRIVSASNEDLAAMVRRGRFRRDLLYRLNVLTLTLPPLRERQGDAELLAAHFLAKIARQYGTAPGALTTAARLWLEAQDWPGNVRELENRVHRAVVTSAGDVLDFGQQEDRTDGPAVPSFNEAKQAAIRRFEQSYLTALLEQTGGNVSRAARLAGKERRCFGKLLSKHTIEVDAFRGEN